MTARLVSLIGLLLAVLVAFTGCAPPKDSGPVDGPFRLSLEVPSKVQPGETVPLKLTLKNMSEAPIEVGLTSRPEEGFTGSKDFVVTRGGRAVWRWRDWLSREGYAWTLVLWSVTLDPGEGLEFNGEWNQVDDRGRPVPPGTYFVRGVLELLLQVSTPQEAPLELETEAKPLVISP